MEDKEINLVPMRNESLSTTDIHVFKSLNLNYKIGFFFLKKAFMFKMVYKKGGKVLLNVHNINLDC